MPRAVKRSAQPGTEPSGSHQTAGAVHPAARKTGRASGGDVLEAAACQSGPQRGRISLAAEPIRVQWFEGPLGPMVAGATGAGICLLQFWEPAPPELVVAAIGRSHAGPVCWGTNEHLEQLRRELELYFTVGCRFTVSLATAGTPFQERVWNSLRTIPYGATRSYEWVARTIGSPKAVRAVGLANGRNPVALVIPCHRVVNKDGGLGGYGGGVARKRWLLEWEASEARGPAATNA